MVMKRICKLPSIQEYADRWGAPTGQYYVNDVQGEIDEEMWGEVKLFEGYYTSPETAKEVEMVKEMVSTGVINKKNFPIMERLLSRAGGQIWQMNLRYKVLDDATSEYVRTYAVFGEVTLREWTEEHDKKVLELQKKVDRKNKGL
jgi:hypothetical protein